MRACRCRDNRIWVNRVTKPRLANRWIRLELLTIAALLALTASPVRVADAQEKPQAGRLSLELNALDTTAKGCQLTFVMQNRLGARLEALRFELAVFNSAGRVNTVITLDAGSLPEEKTRVARFVVSDLACPEVGRVLLNDISACKGQGMTPAICLAKMRVSSRAEAAFIF